MRDIGRELWGVGLGMAALALMVAPARAEVVTRTETGFVIRLASEVTATPAEAWKTIQTPAQWWQSQHTFSGDAANLTLDPQVGGCFCETLPRPDGAPATQKPGGVQHMRVIYIEPPRAMRLSGALGPLQSEALAATMTITVKPTDKGSRILFEYVVGGFMRYKVDEIAPAVDRMLTAQLSSLAGKLGPVADPAPKTAPESDAAAAKDEAAPAVVPLKGAESFSLPPKGGKPAPKTAAKPKPAPEPEAKPDPAPAAPKTAAATAPSAKAPVKSAYMAPTKTAAVAQAKAPAKAGAKPAPKPVKKPAAKAPDLEADAHRDANAAFDAALGSKPNP